MAEAFEASRAELEALRGKRLTPLRVDVHAASVVALSVAVRDAAPARRDAFERLSLGGFYDLTTLSRLERFSRAAWYARERQTFHEAIASEARVPNDMLREARARRVGMLRVLEFWFGQRPRLATEPAEEPDPRPDLTPELASLCGAVSYLDLMNDLMCFARLYERDDIRAILARSDPSYRKTDAAEARRLAHAIADGLGLRAERESRRWASLTHRAFTLLARTYEAHKRSGIYAFGEREDTSRTYPTLVTAVRARARRGVQSSS